MHRFQQLTNCVFQLRRQFFRLPQAHPHGLNRFTDTQRQLTGEEVPGVNRQQLEGAAQVRAGREYDDAPARRGCDRW